MRCKQYILLRDYKSLIGLCMQIIIYPSVKCAYLIYLENFNQPKNKSQYEICFHNVAQLITCRQQHYQHPWSLIISYKHWLNYFLFVRLFAPYLFPYYLWFSVRIRYKLDKYMAQNRGVFSPEIQWDSCASK